MYCSCNCKTEITQAIPVLVFKNGIFEKQDDSQTSVYPLVSIFVPSTCLVGARCDLTLRIGRQDWDVRSLMQLDAVK